MNEEQLQEVIEAHGGELTDEQMAELLDGNLDPVAGDTDVDEPNHEPEEDQSTEKSDGQELKSSEPEAEDEETAAGSEEPDEEEEPVIVAKDGKHEIPYQKLVEARDSEKDAKAQARQWQEIAEQKEKLIEAMKAEGDSQDEGKTDTLSESMQDLLDDYPEAAGQIKELMESNTSLSQKIGELEKVLENLNAENETARHFARIRDAHKDFETIFQSPEYGGWVEKQPAFLRASIQAVYESGTADQVIELLDTYKQAVPGDTGDVGSGRDDLKQTVEQKVRQASEKAAAPASLSDIPGSEAHHDAGEAMAEMSPTALMDTFEGKSQEQIEELLTRVL